MHLQLSILDYLYHASLALRPPATCTLSWKCKLFTLANLQVCGARESLFFSLSTRSMDANPGKKMRINDGSDEENPILAELSASIEKVRDVQDDLKKVFRHPWHACAHAHTCTLLSYTCTLLSYTCITSFGMNLVPFFVALCQIPFLYIMTFNIGCWICDYV